ncbi:MAG: hypothetical protein JWO31_3268 [Phycisphaerales bacterium]|nr:hypothetical protein [Phycisphaerales bacterium]
MQGFGGAAADSGAATGDDGRGVRRFDVVLMAGGGGRPSARIGAGRQTLARAAPMIASATAPGAASITTWHASTDVTSAFILSAMDRWSSGRIARSPVART